ncbi:MAG TPA: DUF2188 domain-containing protein [Microlunatus sp.]|nr:DUF2188 domain-containing protein [Microlunatus sp.]
MTRTEFHVVSRAGRWEVEQAGRSLGRYETRDQAVEIARDRSRSVQPSRVVLHGEDGAAHEVAP